tara:strand:+ start:1044 stop:1802 length:759 start_codon:yes stop_codon:yes gene_type:complete
MTKTVLITGATSGIGKALVQRFSQEKYNIIITGRRENRLKKIKIENEELFNNKILTLKFDITNHQIVKNSLNSLPNHWKKIDILVNNAGLARGLDKIQDASIKDWEEMIDTNIKGLLYVSHIVSNWMEQHNKGHIINIGSTAGKEVYEKGGVYCATKHAVDAISKSLRIDLLKSGIKVTQVCPGAVKTEFSKIRFHGNTKKANDVYSGYTPLRAEEVADVIFYTSNLPANVCINDLVITSLNQANSFYISRR